MNRVKAFVRRVLSWLFTIFAKQTCGEYKSLKANFYTRLTSRTRVGENVNFNGCVVYGRGEVIIGDNFHSGKGLKILTEIHDYRGKALPYDDTFIFKTTEIGDNVWLGMGVMLLPGVKIGNGAIVQAGSVVVKDIPALAIAGGHPAVPFATRDEGHYQRLLQEEAFH